MPLLTITNKTFTAARFQIEDSIAAELKQYAQFLTEDAAKKGRPPVSSDDVVNHALAHVFGADKEYQQHRKEGR